MGVYFLTFLFGLKGKAVIGAGDPDDSGKSAVTVIGTAFVSYLALIPMGV